MVVPQSDVMGPNSFVLPSSMLAFTLCFFRVESKSAMLESDVTEQNSFVLPSYLHAFTVPFFLQGQMAAKNQLGYPLDK